MAAPHRLTPNRLDYARNLPLYGIVIYMYAQDHPPPHFHAAYGDEAAQIDIGTGNVLEGRLPRRALRLVQDWAELHREELLENFAGLQQEIPRFRKIQPLR